MPDNPIFKSRAEQRIEAREGREIPVILRDLYHKQGQSQEQIAETLRVSRGTVIEWMRKYSIPTGYNRTAVA
jgi:transposase